MIVVYQSETVLPDNEADLLSKILDSVGKSISGIVLKNASEMAVDCEDYVGCTFLLFGLKVTSISHFPQNTYSFENLGGNTILASDSLSDLATDTSLKMKLWNSLKSLKN